MSASQPLTLETFARAARASTSDVRTPPHSIAAERSTLGACLLAAGAIDAAARILEPADYYRHDHRLMYDAMLRLRATGRPIDYLTLSDALGPERVADIGPAYITALIDGVPHSTNVEHYARIVAEHATRRRLIMAGERLLTEAYGGARTATDIVTDAVDAISRTAAAAASARPEPALATLRDRLARPRMVTTWRIAELQKVAARVMLAAPQKAGKTTFVGDLVRSLVDDDVLFLGRYAVMPIDGTVGIVDTEMSEWQNDDWLRAKRIRHDDRVLVVSLRGAVRTFDILNAACRAKWASRLRGAGVKYLILDCLRPVMDALGLDEHRDAGRLLEAIDALLYEAEIPEACVVHHMGHGAERSRGDSRLRDWPDVEWRMMRRDADDPASERFFAAYGRDVDVHESALVYDEANRHLTIEAGSRADTARDDTLAEVLSTLSGREPLSMRSIEAALRSSHSRDRVRVAIHHGVSTGAITASHGPRRAILLSVRECAVVSDDCAARTASECAGTYIVPRTRALATDLTNG